MLEKLYDEVSREVIESYKTTQSIRQTMKDTKLSFEEVWDMLGFKDWFDYDTLNVPKTYLRRSDWHKGIL